MQCRGQNVRRAVRANGRSEQRVEGAQRQHSASQELATIPVLFGFMLVLAGIVLLSKNSHFLHIADWNHS